MPTARRIGALGGRLVGTARLSPEARAQYHGAAPRLPMQQALALKVMQGAAHGDPGHRQLLHQGLFRIEQRAGLEMLGDDFPQTLAHLLMQGHTQARLKPQLAKR